jgi:hypothetical protein
MGCLENVFVWAGLGYKKYKYYIGVPVLRLIFLKIAFFLLRFLKWTTYCLSSNPTKKKSQSSLSSCTTFWRYLCPDAGIVVSRLSHLERPERGAHQAAQENGGEGAAQLLQASPPLLLHPAAQHVPLQQGGQTHQGTQLHVLQERALPQGRNVLLTLD